MANKVSKSEELIDRLKAEGKAKKLNSPDHIEAILKMNHELERMRREYKVKERNSLASASKVVLTA